MKLEKYLSEGKLTPQKMDDLVGKGTIEHKKFGKFKVVDKNTTWRVRGIDSTKEYDISEKDLKNWAVK